MGALVTRISGKIGGQTLGTGPAGSYIKNTGTPRKSITLPQRSKMALMATTSQRWRELTQLQRDTFNAASPDYTYLNRVGETKNYSGYAIFCQLANNVINTFNEVHSPAIPIPLPRITFPHVTSFTVSGDHNSLRWAVNPTKAGFQYRLFMSIISSPGVSQGYRNKFNVRSLSFTSNGFINETIGSFYTHKFGSIPTSGRFFARLDIVHVGTGQILKGAASTSHTY